MFKKIPGGWITVLVGGSVALYLFKNATENDTLSKFYDDTVGALTKVIPGGFYGTMIALAAVGGFINRQTTGEIAGPAIGKV